MDQQPQVSPELLAFLEQVFPDRAPDDGMTMEQVWLAAGAAKVVRKLRAMHAAQLAREAGEDPDE